MNISIQNEITNQNLTNLTENLSNHMRKIKKELNLVAVIGCTKSPANNSL